MDTETLSTPPSWWRRFREERASQFQEIRRSLYAVLRNPLSIVGMAIVTLFLLVSLVGPWVVPYPEDARGATHLAKKLTAPNAEHWFGTDEVGRDLFTLVIVGTRLSLRISLIVVGVAILIGVPLGVLAGYVGGWIGEVIMRVTDIFLAVPGLILAIAIVASLGPGITNAMIALSLVWWPGYVRLVQGKTLSVKTESFIEAARCVGSSRWRIAFGEILPNLASPILVKASMDMGLAILGAAGLGFIGIGAQPPTPEWGAMISTGRNYLPDRWWYATFPGGAIFLTVLGWNLLGDGLRDVLDPRSRL
jgi:peptide/nickel transport system permease protein